MSTKIEWTQNGETWNPIAGCSKVSDGCKNCYAIKDAHRLAGHPNPKIAAKYEGTTKIENGKMNWTGRINLASEDVLLQPMRWTRPRKIFVNSMSDLFHESVPDEWIDKIFAVMALSPQHTFQILTKRAGRMKEYFNRFGKRNIHPCFFLAKQAVSLGMATGSADFLYRGVFTNSLCEVLSHVHLGVSVENQKEADKRIPLLLETPAAVRWLSCEPLLGEIDLTMIAKGSPIGSNISIGINVLNQEYSSVDWVVAGGESGANARPVHPDWIRHLRDQCVSAGVPFFFKQWGSWFPLCEKVVEGAKWSIGQAKALSHLHLWNDDGGNVSLNIGKKNAGRFLDGRTWDEFPK